LFGLFLTVLLVILPIIQIDIDIIVRVNISIACLTITVSTDITKPSLNYILYHLVFIKLQIIGYIKIVSHIHITRLLLLLFSLVNLILYIPDSIVIIFSDNSDLFLHVSLQPFDSLLQMADIDFTTITTIIQLDQLFAILPFIELDEILVLLIIIIHIIINQYSASVLDRLQSVRLMYYRLKNVIIIILILLYSFVLYYSSSLIDLSDLVPHLHLVSLERILSIIMFELSLLLFPVLFDQLHIVHH